MHLPAQALQTIPITWSFAVWGMDLVGPLQKAPGGFTHLLVAIDKFSKWIEVRPLTSIGSEQAVVFFTNIIHRFGIPNSIITDNGTQFTGKKFLDFCEGHHIRVDWAAVALLHSARYQQSLRRYHARRIWPRGFQVGDLVLRLRQDA
jgi:transposase InsO family protein